MKHLIFLCYAVLAFHMSVAQRTPEFSHYSRRDGLSSSNIRSMLQDQDGFLWVAQNTGIHRFNGYRFEDFTKLIKDSNKTTVYTHIAQGADNALLIGTETSGLIRYVPESNTLDYYRHDPKDANSINSNFVSNIFIDNKNRVWVGTWFGLNRLNKDGTFESFRFANSGSSNIFAYNVIEDIKQDANGDLWIATWGGGLHYFNMENAEFEHFEKVNETDNKNLWIKDIEFDENGRLYLATIGDGILIFDPVSRTFEKPVYNVPTTTIGFSRILDLAFLKEHILWAASEEGLIIINLSEGKTTVINDQGSEATSLQHKDIEIIYQDNHSGVWIGGGGISYFNSDAAKFELYKHQPNENSLSDNGVKCFLEIDKSTIWISTDEGINVWNRNSNTFELLKIFPEAPHILVMWEGVVYAAIPRGGLYSYELASGELRHFDQSIELSEGLLDDHIRGMTFDPYGNLWIANLKGLSVKRSQDDKFIHFIENLKYSNGLKGLSVSAITCQEREIWMLNHRYVLRLNQLDSMLLAKDGPAGLISDTTLYAFEAIDKFGVISTIQSDRENIYCTNEDGLVIYDTQSKDKKLVDFDGTLSGDNIQSISMDYYNGIWLATDDGVSYLNTSTGEVTDFYEEDGLQGNFFQRNVALTTSDGLILLGGNNGFNVIDPQEIELNPYTPPVWITDIQIFNQSIPVVTSDTLNKSDEFTLDINPSYINEITLNHDQNSLTFEFSPLNFLYPEKNKISYYIEGVDKEWNVVNRRYASYNDLPEGKWLTLQYKAANNDGIWNPTSHSIKLYITPPFYDTIWFRILALSILAILALLFYQVRIRRLKRNQRELQKQVEIRTREIEIQKGEIQEQNEHLNSQNKNIALFSEIGKQITTAISIEDMFERTFLQLRNFIDTDHLAIGRVSAGNVLLYWEMGSDQITEQSIDLKNIRRLSALAFNKGTVITSGDIKNEVTNWLEHPTEDYQTMPYHSVAYLPLSLKDKGVIGIFVAKSKKKNAFSERDIALLENISTYMTIALENASAYDQIRKQSKQLQELDRIKTRFYTNISHEFRTPLSLIMGPTEELIKNPKLSVKEREYLDIINQNAKRMLRLVTQVLDLSKLEDGVLRLAVAHGDIINSVKSIVDSFQFLAENKNINLEWKTASPSQMGFYDQDKIEKIVYNLLNNAFKYTERDGDILVKTEVVESAKQPKSISIVIIDTGMGIPKDQLEQIFETYYRVDNRETQKQTGAGIGLSLVKKLVALHHGQISVESQEGKGTTFVVHIPISESAYTSSELLDTIVQNPDRSLHLHGAGSSMQDFTEISIKKVGQKRIVLAEDNEELLKFMVNSLQEEYEIIPVKDGSEAFEAIMSKPPHLVISDVMMPLMDGYQLCSKIKSDEKLAHIPVILLTAKTSLESQKEGLSLGADEYLAKPVNMDLLKLRIENLLSTSERIRNKFESKLVMDVNDLQVGDEHEPFLKDVTRVLEENITNKDVNIDLFANELGMSRTLLYEKIKKATGESMGAFIKKNRLNYSAKLLLENHYNTSQLAYEVGFSDPKYFAKCFRKQFGKTPKDYLQSKMRQD